MITFKGLLKSWHKTLALTLRSLRSKRLEGRRRLGGGACAAYPSRRPFRPPQDEGKAFETGSGLFYPSNPSAAFTRRE
jgi:hypothetical protein